MVANVTYKVSRHGLAVMMQAGIQSRGVAYLGVIHNYTIKRSNGKQHPVRQLEGLLLCGALLLASRITAVMACTSTLFTWLLLAVHCTRSWRCVLQSEQPGTEPNSHHWLQTASSMSSTSRPLRLFTTAQHKEEDISLDHISCLMVRCTLCCLGQSRMCTQQC